MESGMSRLPTSCRSFRRQRSSTKPHSGVLPIRKNTSSTRPATKHFKTTSHAPLYTIEIKSVS